MFDCDENVLPLWYQRLAASHIYLTRLDVYLWLPAQSQVSANALSWLGEFAMHPAPRVFLPQCVTVHVHIQQIKYSNVSKTSKLLGWLRVAAASRLESKETTVCVAVSNNLVILPE